jgi:hypothetical protein
MSQVDSPGEPSRISGAMKASPVGPTPGGIAVSTALQKRTSVMVPRPAWLSTIDAGTMRRMRMPAA